MPNWFTEVQEVLTAIREKIRDLQFLKTEGDPNQATAVRMLNGYVKRDFERLAHLWKEAGLEARELASLQRHIKFGQERDYIEILQADIHSIQTVADTYVESNAGAGSVVELERLLHPLVFKYAYPHLLSGHFREAVLNSIVGVFDLIRERTGLLLDGPALVTQAFSLQEPRLILAELETESGLNDQKGFLQMFTGAYIGIRNPKSHSLHHDLDWVKAAQYLIFASILARRVGEATLVK